MVVTIPDFWREQRGNKGSQYDKIVEIINAVNALTAGDWLGSVLDRLATPPAHSAGERYLIIATASGDWTGKEDQIAESDGAAWSYTIPTEGARVWVEDENAIYQYISSWQLWEDQALATSSSPTFVDLILSGLTASYIVETDGSKQLTSAAKSTAYNKAFGTGSGQVSEGNHSHSSGQLFAWYQSSSGSATFSSGVSGNQDITYRTVATMKGAKKTSTFNVSINNTGSPGSFTLYHSINGGSSYVTCESWSGAGTHTFDCTHNTVQSVASGDDFKFRFNAPHSTYSITGHTHATIWDGYEVT